MADDLQRRVEYLEEELRTLRTALAAPWRAVVEDMTECVVRWRPDGIRLFVNGAYCRLFGGTRQEFEGTSFWPLVAEPDREHVRQRIESMGPDRRVSTGMHRVKRPDGSVSWMEWTDRALFDAEWNVVEFQSVGRDISERVRLQEYARRVQLADGVSRASAAIAHDLANVFQVLDAVIVEQATRHPHDEGLADATAVLSHGQALLDQLRDLRYGRAVARTRLDLAERITQAAAVLRTMVGATLHVHVQATPQGLGVTADPTQIDQILFNLARNADEVDPPARNITLEVRLAHASELDGHAFSGPPPPRCVLLCITDDAGGIPADLLPHVFEHHVTTKARGQGLGLATVKAIVAAHEGSVVVRTSEQGTTFEIALPHAAPGPVRQASNGWT